MLGTLADHWSVAVRSLMWFSLWTLEFDFDVDNVYSADADYIVDTVNTYNTLNIAYIVDAVDDVNTVDVIPIVDSVDDVDIIDIVNIVFCEDDINIADNAYNSSVFTEQFN